MNEKSSIIIEVVNSIESAYKNFVLRDLLSVTLPGFIFSLTLIYIWKGGIAEIKALNVWEFIFILLISYPLGWSILYLGVFVRAVKLSKTNFRWECPWNYKSIDDGLRNNWQKELRFFENLNRLKDKDVIDVQRERTYYERIILIRQMLGNFGASLLLSSILLLIFKCGSLSGKGLPFFLVCFSLVLIFCGLIFAHRRLIEQIDLWLESRIIFGPEDDNN